MVSSRQAGCLPDGPGKATLEPVGSDFGDPFQGARLLEQMRGPGNNGQVFLRRAESIEGLAVKVDNRNVAATDDQQGGSLNAGQGVSRQVRPAAARNDGA